VKKLTGASRRQIDRFIAIYPLKKGRAYVWTQRDLEALISWLQRVYYRR